MMETPHSSDLTTMTPVMNVSMGHTPIMDSPMGRFDAKTTLSPSKQARGKDKGPRRPRSVVWYYFDKIPGETQRARCKLCGAHCHHANNTSNLFKHLRVKHPSTFREAETQREAEMDLYIEMKNKTGKPVVRTGVRGRRPKGFVAAPNSSSYNGVSSSSLNTPDIKPQIGIKRAYTPSRIRQQINKALLKMLTVDLQPLSIVEGKGFREFCKNLDPHYDLPHKKTTIKTLMNDFAEETKNKIKLEVVIASFFALSVDSWVYRNSQSMVTLTGHFIKDNWEKSSVVLETFDRTEDTTDDALSLSIKRVTDDWNISDRIVSGVSDGIDASVASSVLTSGWEHLNCFGATLNTLIMNALTSVSEIVRIQKKTHEAVGYFGMCVKASDTLSAVQQQHSLPVHKLKQENPKFWNSTFKMFQRMVEQYEAVNTVLCFLSKDHMCLCDDEVELMRSVIEVLRPFQAATEEICAGGSGYTFMSKVIPIATLLQQVTASSLEAPLPGPQSALKTALLQQMQQYFATYENTYLLAVSTLLDPRFKRHAFTDNVALDTAQQRLLGEITQTVQNSDMSGANRGGQGGGGGGFNGEAAGAGAGGAAGGDNSFWNMFDRKVSEAGAMKNHASEAENESRRYFKEANIPRKADPLQWWRLNEVQFPHLKLLAQKYLCIPATAVSTDRLFSKHCDVIDSRRDAIKPNQINTVLFLNKNLI